LRGIKLAIVLSVINPLTRVAPWVADNGFGAQNLGYSYSGLYQEIDPLDFNVKSLIDNDKFDEFNNLHERLPVVKYAIYGFSSFNLADGSGCTSFSLDLTLDGVNALTVSTNQKSSLTDVVIQSDQYFPQTQAVCAPGVEFSKLAISDITVAAAAPFINTLTPNTNLDNSRDGTLPQSTNLKYIKTRLS
jgi:hypothetical protein